MATKQQIENAQIAAEEAERARRAAVIKQATTDQTQRVKVTVTKFGAGRVSTGEHVANAGDIMAERGAELEVHPDVAAELEKRGFVETADA